MFSIASLLAGTAANEIGQSYRQLRWKLIIYSVVGLLFLTAYASAVVATVLQLSTTMGVIEALVATSLVTVTLAILIFAGVKIRNEVIKARRKRQSNVNTLAVAAGLSIMPGLVKNRGVFAAVAVAGLAALASTSWNSSK